ncbi:MAG: SWIM zinc finger family protein, partial [Ilumatobacteraceae bacterium]
MSRPRSVVGPNPPGRLPAAMLRALAAELSDPGRFSRAKAYARDGAVIDIDIGPGEVRATIQGSRYEPYVASVYVAPSDDHDSLLGLIPDRDEVRATCTCPDDGPYGGAFCKHALATLLALADEATI